MSDSLLWVGFVPPTFRGFPQGPRPDNMVRDSLASTLAIILHCNRSFCLRWRAHHLAQFVLQSVHVSVMNAFAFVSGPLQIQHNSTKDPFVLMDVYLPDWMASSSPSRRGRVAATLALITRHSLGLSVKVYSTQWNRSRSLSRLNPCFSSSDCRHARKGDFLPPLQLAIPRHANTLTISQVCS